MSQTKEHICDHFHQCLENCYLKNNTQDCKGQCILKYGHTEQHICGYEKHHCNSIFSLSEKARNCKIKCNLEFPHSGGHAYGNKHYCKENLLFKEEF